MTDTWAAKVLEGVPRFQTMSGNMLPYADVLVAIAKLADGGGLVDRATAALEGVTDGPWAVECKYGTTRLLMGNQVAMCDEKYYPWTPENDKDWHFIAFTRQWVPEAADRIAALTAERDEARGLALQLQSECEELHSEAAALRAKVARLKGALTEIDALDPEKGYIGACSENAIRGLVLRMGEIARAVLTDGAADE